MQLSSRILTALAVLILAVAVVAVRAGSPDTVEAATGTIDVLNVGTCYATDDEVFGIGDCDADDEVDYNVAGRDEVGEVATVYATYAHDPKTAPDNPRAVLKNANLIKISIADSGRDKRTPVMLPVGNALAANLDPCDDTDNNDATNCDFSREDIASTTETVEKGYLEIVTDFLGTAPILKPTMSWQPRDDNDRGIPANNGGYVLSTPGVETGITVLRSDNTLNYLPMDVSDDSLVTFWGIVRDTNDDNSSPFGQLKTLELDEDVGSGAVAMVDGDDHVAPWLSIRKSITAGREIVLMYIVYHTSEWETLIGGNTLGAYNEDDGEDNEAPFAPDFSNAEKKNTSAQIVVEARSDGREGRQQLHLHETGRFTGRYEGYLKLTDENGGGADADGWGLSVDDAKGYIADEAAVIGVESGPVVIAYKDTDGSTQLHEIEIDTGPPEITIDSPAHESQGQDTSPEFSGSFLDRGGSGLREDTFHLYVDHKPDDMENGVTGVSLALNLPVVVNASGGGKVESLEDYAGYSITEPMPYAVIRHNHVFGLDSDARDTTDSLESVEADDFSDGDTTGTFGDSVRIDFDLGDEDTYNHTIDFHAVVADIAGNLGFSDSDNDGPRFINNLGEESSDRKTDRYNVIGWYARHIFFLDETDPKIYQEQSVTGFYGENDDDVPQASRSGILVAFDKAVDPDSIGVDTFSVSLDSAGTQQVGIIDVDVEGRAVYLLLESELASDALPYVDIAAGEWVSDPAGNRLTGGAQRPFVTKDGIAPELSVTMSGGSGTGEGGEGPSALTNSSIIVTIAADEEINSTPSLLVVCSNIAWDSDGDGENDKSLDDVSAQRSGALTNGSASFTPPSTDAADRNLYGSDFSCGDETVEMQQLQSYSRPGLTWEYEWVDLNGDKGLPDGKLTVVAFARDRQSYASLSSKRTDGDPAQSDTYNWGAATAEFRYDTTLNDPDPTPGDGDTVTESRPFVLLGYDDATTVAIDELMIDGTVQEISSIGGNRFLYWPESLDIGSHAVSVDAVDAAGNTDSFEYSFKVAERSAFNLKLIAGWNAVSFPANPADNAIENVFTEGVVDMVAGWDASDPEKPWSIATRMEDEWSTHEEFATLNKVHAQYGYWVHAQGFVTQRVKLVGGINRTDPEITPPDLVSIPTLPGWNFVGVIDQDGDQTEDDFGETLANGDTAVDAGDYLGSNKGAYTWDAVRSEFKVLEDDDDIEIGQGIWVYFGGGIAP